MPHTRKHCTPALEMAFACTGYCRESVDVMEHEAWRVGMGGVYQCATIYTSTYDHCVITSTTYRRLLEAEEVGTTQTKAYAFVV